MCTVAGYLYVADDRAPPPMVTGPQSARLLEERFALLAAKMGEAIDLAGPSPSVDEAVGAYLRFYRVWAGEVAPMLETARAGAMSRAHKGIVGGSPIARAVAAAARGEKTRSALIREIGDLALAWDVASPTLAERPELIDAAIAAARAAMGDAAPDEPESQRKSMAEMALELSETDDLWFARAQAMVRRALLAAGDRLGIGDDVFWLPLEELDGELDPAAAHARASAARTAAERARSWEMPRVVGGTAERSGAGTGTGTGTGEWRGLGQGRAAGTVKRLVGASVVPPGTVVVARAITPAIALLVPAAAALISETGGILAHGAAIARELGIPFVVGCDGVWDGLDDGDEVEIDGDAGLVRRLSQRDA
jgi:pyruvate,water dikinase